MAQSTSRQLRQLLRMRNGVTTLTSSVTNRNVTTAHSGSLLKAGVDLENPDVLYGSSSWRWIRPANAVEADLDDWNKHKSRIAVAYATINADREITENIWKQMLVHLANQMPCLRMVVLPHKNEKWICHVDNMEIPLKMFENVDSLDILEEMFDGPFENGPLVVKVVRANPDDVCPIPEVKKTKPFQYDLFMDAHHGLLDGYSTALMTRIAIDILNTLLAGKTVNDKIQICEPIRFEEVTAKRIRLKETLENNPRWFQREKERLLSTFKSPLLNEAFPAPNVATSKTARSILYLNPLTLKAFHKQCKVAGVSVTNGLVAAINTVMVEMVREAGILRESYNLTLNTNVDLRRYMNIRPFTGTGMLVGGMHQSMHPTSNIREEFWEHAKTINDDAKTLLKSDGALIESVIRAMAVPKADADAIFNSSKEAIMQRDYTFNNLKDLTPVLYNPKKHKHAEQTGAVITSSLHNFNPMMFSLCTYRGIISFNLEYDTKVLSQKTAEELLKRINLLINEKSKTEL